MNRVLGLFGAIALLATTGVQANSFDINLNEDSARLTFGQRFATDRLYWDLGWLRQQDDGDVVHLGLYRVGDTSFGSGPIRAGVGGRGFYADGDFAEGFALGLGGFFDLEVASVPRLHFGAFAYFAPDVLSGGDVEKYREAGLRVGYEILEGAEVYLGYRYIKSDFEDADSVTLDEDAHVGLRIRF